MSSFGRPANRSAPLRPAPAQAPAMRPQAPGMSDKVEIIQPEQYTDRRSEPRFDCDDRGALLFLSSNEIVNCRILDQSASGARVAFDRISNLPPEIWLIDLDRHTVRHGTAAWSTMNRMGLKFDLIQQLTADMARPAKVPQSVFDAWLRLSGHAPAKPATGTGGDDGVLYFD